MHTCKKRRVDRTPERRLANVLDDRARFVPDWAYLRVSNAVKQMRATRETLTARMRWFSAAAAGTLSMTQFFECDLKDAECVRRTLSPEALNALYVLYTREVQYNERHTFPAMPLDMRKLRADHRNALRPLHEVSERVICILSEYNDDASETNIQSCNGSW